MSGENDVTGSDAAMDRFADKLFGTEPAQPEQAQADDQAEDQPEDVEAAADTEAESEAVEGTEEEAVIELDGEKLTPAQIKAELDKARDYTRKTQAVAEERRVFEAQQRLAQEHAAFQEHAKAEFEQLAQINAQLEQYKRVDLSTVDAESLSRMSMLAANLREEKARLQESLGQKQGQFRQNAYKAWDEMATRAREAMTKEIPDWNSAAPKLAQWALQQGYPFEVITGYDQQTRERVGPGVVDPTFARTLYKAWKFDQLQAAKPAANAKAAKAPPVLGRGVTTANANQLADARIMKAIKNAKSDGQKADLIGARLAAKFKF